MEINHKRQIKIPHTPNFILPADGSDPIPISAFTDAELTLIAQAWARELIIKAQNMRGQSKGQE